LIVDPLEKALETKEVDVDLILAVDEYNAAVGEERSS
jgi:hypothetical protein